MTSKSGSEDVHALSNLLEAERQALLMGELQKLPDLLDSKEELMEAVAHASAIDAAVMRMLDAKVKRNQLLLDGAMEGIREVARRLAELGQMEGPLATYGADGQRQMIETRPASSVEKRA